VAKVSLHKLVSVVRVDEPNGEHCTVDRLFH